MFRSTLLAAASALTLAACATAQPTTGTGMTEPTTETQPAQAAMAPLTEAWTGPFGGVPPWDQVSAEKFPAAYEQALAELRTETQAIARNRAAPNFENTIAAMERSGRTLDRLQNVFGVLSSNLSTPEVQAVEAEWSPKLAAAADEIFFNKPLFDRIAAVHAARDGLEPDQRRLTEIIYDRFVTRGAQLDDPGKARLGEINQRLATLFAEFSKRVLADESTYITLDSQDDLAGLPADYVAAAKAAAEEKGVAGWIIANTRSSVDPFLTSSSRRDLREQVWKAFKNRGDSGGANDTNPLIAEIVALRAERAKLLGFESHAHWRMFDTMAKDPARAMDLMQRVWTPAVARVREEVADMRALARRDGVRTFEPWDYLYYAEKVRKAKYDLDQSQLKPYFELDNMMNAAFFTAEQLYGLQFVEITGQVPVFHPDVRVYEVKDKANGAHRGLFYIDNFAREGKRSGAWMTSYRVYETFDGRRTPLVSNNNNFVKGAPGEPVLISLDDAETLFHEFGHALHYLLSNVRYPGLSTTPRDFVEYPSQVMEHFVLSEPILDRFARHYQTGEKMPPALLEKVRAARTFNQGYATVEYLSAALVDMRMHMTPEAPTDPDAFEREALSAIGMPREIAMRHRLPQFLHLFSDDSYSAGYYSYLWSEVMDADTWRAFEESGNVFDPGIAAKMREHILAPLNATDRAEAFRQLRGRDPDVKALLEVRGFPTGAAR